MCRTHSFFLPGHRIWSPDACFQTLAPPSAHSLSLGSVVAPLCLSLRTCKLGAAPFLFLRAAASLGAAGPSASARLTERVVTRVSSGRDVAQTSLSPWRRPLGRVGCVPPAAQTPSPPPTPVCSAKSSPGMAGLAAGS